MLFLDLLDLAIVTAGEAELVLLSFGRITGIQAQLARLVGDLLKSELGQVVGDHERPLPFDMDLGVDDIDLSELPAGRLHVEEPAVWDSEQVNQGKEEIDTPGARVGKNRREHDHGKVADPVGAGRRCGARGTGTEGIDLGRVDPGQRQEGEGEESDEEEDTHDGTLGVLLGSIDQASECDDKTETLAKETIQVQL